MDLGMPCFCAFSSNTLKDHVGHNYTSFVLLVCFEAPWCSIGVQGQPCRVEPIGGIRK